MLPLMNREIPIITDELAHPEFGTGAVKVTPAHDPNDFEAGLRHNLPQIEVMDEHARMNENAGPYTGLDRFAAREQVVADLDRAGFLVGTKDYTIAARQVRPLQDNRRAAAVDAVVHEDSAAGEARHRSRGEGEHPFTPENYGQIYFNWMRNIHDWCISRQLWWGHRIPAWHCTSNDCKEVIVAREAPAKCPNAAARSSSRTPMCSTLGFRRDCLPFTTLGWPEPTRDLDVFYPNYAADHRLRHSVFLGGAHDHAGLPVHDAAT